jgi:hypothetical protein
MSILSKSAIVLPASSRKRNGGSPGLADNFESSNGSRRGSLALTDNFESSTPLGNSSRRGSLALTDNFESSTPLGNSSRRGSLALTDNFESTGATPVGSRRASLALSDNHDRTPSHTRSRSEEANITLGSSGRTSAGMHEHMSDERHVMNLAIEAHEKQKNQQKQSQLEAASKLKSNLLRVFLTSAVTGSMSKWSKAAKKAFLLSAVDSKLTRIHIERMQLKVMFLLAIMNSACIALQCASSRVLENGRDAEVARQQNSNLVACCKGFNLTLSNGACGETDSVARKTCKIDASLIVTTNTDDAVAYGTQAFWMSFYLCAAVSALSIISVVSLFYHAYLSKKLHAFSKQLETKHNSKSHSTIEGSTSFMSIFTPMHWFEIVLALIHMPPLPFDIPTLEFEHPFYTETKKLKFPWISLISAVVTLSLPPFLSCIGCPCHLIT